MEIGAEIRSDPRAIAPPPSGRKSLAMQSPPIFWLFGFGAGGASLSLPRKSAGRVAVAKRRSGGGPCPGRAAAYNDAAQNRDPSGEMGPGSAKRYCVPQRVRDTSVKTPPVWRCRRPHTRSRTGADQRARQARSRPPPGEGGKDRAYREQRHLEQGAHGVALGAVKSHVADLNSAGGLRQPGEHAAGHN